MDAQRSPDWPENHVAARKILRQVLRSVGAHINPGARHLELRVAVLLKPDLPKRSELVAVTPPAEAQERVQVRPTVLVVLKRQNTS